MVKLIFFILSVVLSISIIIGIAVSLMEYIIFDLPIILESIIMSFILLMAAVLSVTSILVLYYLFYEIN